MRTPALSFHTKPEILGENEVHRRLTAITVAFDVIGDGLAVIQLVDASAFQRRDVNEYVLRTMGRGDKAETFGFIEKFNNSCFQN